MANIIPTSQDPSQTLNQLRRELRTTRIFCAVSSILTLFLLAGGIWVVTRAQAYMAEITPVVDELAKLDVEEFNRTMVNVNTMLTSVDWEKLSVVLSELDVEALNEAMADLDTEELTEALTNLNDAADTLRGVSDRINSFTSRFGN